LLIQKIKIQLEKIQAYKNCRIQNFAPMKYDLNNGFSTFQISDISHHETIRKTFLWLTILSYKLWINGSWLLIIYGSFFHNSLIFIELYRTSPFRPFETAVIRHTLNSITVTWSYGTIPGISISFYHILSSNLDESRRLASSRASAVFFRGCFLWIQRAKHIRTHTMHFRSLDYNQCFVILFWN